MNIALYQQLQAATNGSVLPAILLTIVLGAVHALSPGHGKTLIVASMVGTQAGVRRVLLLAVTVAATHTAGVLVLALVVTGNETFLPQDVTPYISLLAAILVVLFGVDLTRRAVVARSKPGDHAGGHDHRHPHSMVAMPLSRRYAVAVGVVGGLVPNLTALVVLTIAITFHEILLGVLLVLTFGLGIAATLVAIGFGAMVIAKRGIGAGSNARLAGLVRWLPLGAGLGVVIVGAVLTAQAVLGLQAI